MTDPSGSAWDFQEEASAARDGQSRQAGYPALELALIRAARDSSLRRFYPFTSHYEVRFGTGPRWYLGEDDLLSVGIAPTREGGYLVYSRDDAAPGAPHTEILRTDDAAVAIAQVERLISRGHGPGAAQGG
ncbi:DUF6193 family natural product biosynthesis protein [Yinghuangia seranimata]|uniref:DUF6193 family natural product biosynthesis protein n=1 Tax=Yinghuangia seranimata TaxID=408067 RepID=UPI00248CAEE0|nr:DUF6193 family natural product biosynthesis protein [Yinghuangia seranimata]MDI2126836.1 DUF6193 family natural product biosynthesis protein [Yinghuangia seranimata]